MTPIDDLRAEKFESLLAEWKDAPPGRERARLRHHLDSWVPGLEEARDEAHLHDLAAEAGSTPAQAALRRLRGEPEPPGDREASRWQHWLGGASAILADSATQFLLAGGLFDRRWFLRGALLGLVTWLATAAVSLSLGDTSLVLLWVLWIYLFFVPLLIGVDHVAHTVGFDVWWGHSPPDFSEPVPTRWTRTKGRLLSAVWGALLPMTPLMAVAYAVGFRLLG